MELRLNNKTQITRLGIVLNIGFASYETQDLAAQRTVEKTT